MCCNCSCNFLFLKLFPWEFVVLYVQLTSHDIFLKSLEHACIWSRDEVIKESVKIRDIYDNYHFCLLQLVFIEVNI